MLSIFHVKGWDLRLSKTTWSIPFLLVIYIHSAKFFRSSGHIAKRQERKNYLMTCVESFNNSKKKQKDLYDYIIIKAYSLSNTILFTKHLKSQVNLKYDNFNFPQTSIIWSQCLILQILRHSESRIKLKENNLLLERNN